MKSFPVLRGSLPTHAIGRFEFNDRDLLFNGDGAPTLQVTLTGAF